MSYLIDTNIIAEVRNGSRCDAQVARWWARVADADLFRSVLVLGEIRLPLPPCSGRATVASASGSVSVGPTVIIPRMRLGHRLHSFPGYPILLGSGLA